MIVGFRHKGLERLFVAGETRGVPADRVDRLRRLLLLLHRSQSPAELNLPGLRLHPLKGRRKGEWAMSVSGNWRLVFRFSGADVTDVDLVDYH